MVRTDWAVLTRAYRFIINWSYRCLAALVFCFTASDTVSQAWTQTVKVFKVTIRWSWNRSVAIVTNFVVILSRFSASIHSVLEFLAFWLAQNGHMTWGSKLELLNYSILYRSNRGWKYSYRIGSWRIVKYFDRKHGSFLETVLLIKEARVKSKTVFFYDWYFIFYCSNIFIDFEPDGKKSMNLTDRDLIDILWAQLES